MGSPLSPVIANFCMEEFEKKAIETAIHKPTCWYRYVDDTFTVWPHGQEKLMDFLNHLNWIKDNIQFTVEIEAEGHLPFLDVNIYKKMDGSLGHQVYRKNQPTQNSTYTKNPTTIQLTSIQSSHPWYTEQKLYASKNPLPRNSHYSPMSSNKMVTAINKYNKP
jgi:hypothetical protein